MGMKFWLGKIYPIARPSLALDVVEEKCFRLIWT